MLQSLPSSGMPSADLAAWGWTPTFAAALAEHAPHALPARVLVDHGRACRVIGPMGQCTAVLAADLRRTARGPALPTTGDWVALRLADDGETALIDAVLPRRGAFVRRAAGGDGQGQVVAANVDTVFLVDSLDPGPNPRRLERYLVLAWESGATPVVVLSKADRRPDADHAARAIEAVAPGVPVLTCSAYTGAGLDALAPYLQPGRTVALLGPSGVGKSTLVNALHGATVQRTGAVRAGDGKGRHTTTHRELVRLSSGALLLDTPGMRELGLWTAGEALGRVFGDIEVAAARCRFADCQHAAEPGCAVRAAVAVGDLAAERLVSHQKLRRELARIEARRDPRLAAEARREERAIHRAYNAAKRQRSRHR